MPVVARHVGVEPGLLDQPVDQLPDRVMVRVGVLAHVHRRQVQAEHRDGALDAGQQAVGDQLAGVGAQRLAEQGELGEQLFACRGSRGRARAACRRRPGGGCWRSSR